MLDEIIVEGYRLIKAGFDGFTDWKAQITSVLGKDTPSDTVLAEKYEEITQSINEEAVQERDPMQGAIDAIEAGIHDIAIKQGLPGAIEAMEEFNREIGARPGVSNFALDTIRQRGYELIHDRIGGYLDWKAQMRDEPGDATPPALIMAMEYQKLISLVREHKAAQQ